MRGRKLPAVPGRASPELLAPEAGNRPGDHQREPEIVRRAAEAADANVGHGARPQKATQRHQQSAAFDLALEGRAGRTGAGEPAEAEASAGVAR